MMKRLLLLCVFSLFIQVHAIAQNTLNARSKLPVILDTDANNELDDQHAMVYLLFNDKTFDIKGITTNATKSGGEIRLHTEEARRILQISNMEKVKLFEGANSTFEEIMKGISPSAFDGKEAVDFIIDESKKASQASPLILLPIGKLTNIALAIALAPEIKKHVKIVWLGSNYPAPGEYNQDNDEAALNYILDQEVPFEIVTVRYNTSTGSTAVSVSQAEINEKMPGLGPKANTSITGRHGGSYEYFGDYSVSLFEHIDYYNDKKERALFDVVAVAILKNEKWGRKKMIPAPRLVDGKWVERPTNDRKITVWENFDRDSIITDFFKTLEGRN